jgi:hypothetical protein
MERALGREELLRRLWPAVVGLPLARNAQLKSFRGATVTVSVPDVAWKASLEALGDRILDAVNRFWGEPVSRSIEFAVDTRMTPSPVAAVAGKTGGTRSVPRVDLPLEAIRDKVLRQSLLESAQKYFAAQQERGK